MSTDDAILALRRALTEIHDTMPRCAGCECFLVVAAQAGIDLKKLAGSPLADETRALFDEWLAAAEGHVKTCNHCEVCVPSGPYRDFTAALAAGLPGR